MLKPQPPLPADAWVLKRLIEGNGDPVSGPLLAQELGVSRAAIWKRIEGLQSLGFPIEAQPHLGYRLGNPLPDIVCADELLARLALDARAMGGMQWQPLVFASTASTNDVANREAVHGAAEGLVVVADAQTAGRGRMRRVWSSPPGLGLYVSLLLRPDWPASQAPRLTLLASLAMASACRNLGVPDVRIKWPNDLVVGGRKLAGLLTEVQSDADLLKSAVLGIGINVNHELLDFPEELRDRATSLRITRGGERLRRVEVLAELLVQVEYWVAQPYAHCREQWSEQCLSLGTIVAVETLRGQLSGQAMGLDDDGALLLRREGGVIERVTSGDLIPAN